jgi:hypothetical protein
MCYWQYQEVFDEISIKSDQIRSDRSSTAVWSIERHYLPTALDTAVDCLVDSSAIEMENEVS